MHKESSDEWMEVKGIRTRVTDPLCMGEEVKIFKFVNFTSSYHFK